MFIKVDGSFKVDSDSQKRNAKLSISINCASPKSTLVNFAIPSNPCAWICASALPCSNVMFVMFEQPSNWYAVIFANLLFFAKTMFVNS